VRRFVAQLRGASRARPASSSPRHPAKRGKSITVTGRWCDGQKPARFRDPDRSLDTFDVDFNKKMNRALIYELATARFIGQREDALFLGPPGTGKSHLAQAIGHAAIQQRYRVIYREAHMLLEDLADATLAGTRKNYLAELAAVPLLIIDDLGMRKLPHTAAEDLLDVIMRRYERGSTVLTSNRPVDD
jgi:DNA replication protein DnaC